MNFIAAFLKLRDKILNNIKTWSKWDWLAAAVMPFAAWLRLFRIPETLQFLGDQGRDAMVVADVFRKFDLIFIGPVTSVGNMYLGPFYYYFMLPFLWLTYPSPMGPVYAVAFVGILTVWLTYMITKKMFDQKVAWFSLLLMATMGVAVIASRYSWNPNIAPLFGLLMFFFTYKAWHEHPKNWVWVSVCFSILIQLHYLSLLSAAGAGVVWLASLIWPKSKKVNLELPFQKKKNSWSNFKATLLYSSIALLIFLGSLTPLMLFDAKHNWLNAQAFSKLLTQEENFKHSAELTIDKKLLKTVKETHGRSMHILFEMNIGQNRPLNTALVLAVIALFSWQTKVVWPDLKTRRALLTLLAFMITSILGTAMYEHTIFDHYISYLFALISITEGYLLAKLFNYKLGMLAGGAYLALYLTFNMTAHRYLKPTSASIFKTEKTAKAIADKVAPGENYNIVLLSGTRDLDAQNYRYFLSTSETPPVKIQDRDSVDTLFIINEASDFEKVTDSPAYEIVVFPNKNPTEVFQVENGPEITVLRRHTENEDLLFTN